MGPTEPGIWRPCGVHCTPASSWSLRLVSDLVPLGLFVRRFQRPCGVDMVWIRSPSIRSNLAPCRPDRIQDGNWRSDRSRSVGFQSISCTLFLRVPVAHHLSPEKCLPRVRVVCTNVYVTAVCAPLSTCVHDAPTCASTQNLFKCFSRVSLPRDHYLIQLN